MNDWICSRVAWRTSLVPQNSAAYCLTSEASSWCWRIRRESWSRSLGSPVPAPGLVGLAPEDPALLHSGNERWTHRVETSRRRQPVPSPQALDCRMRSFESYRPFGATWRIPRASAMTRTTGNNWKRTSASTVRPASAMASAPTASSPS